VATTERLTSPPRTADLTIEGVTRERDRARALAEGSVTPRASEDMHVSIEERYDEVRQLIAIGKDNGYLLYEDVNELLPSDLTSSDELDELLNTFASAGIEIIDSDQKYRRGETPLDRTAEGAEELEPDPTAGALDKTHDPVRIYLREMGTVPLLTRESEVTGASSAESAPSSRRSRARRSSPGR
jgi:hypothetical protein